MPDDGPSAAWPAFEAADLLSVLEAADGTALDAMPFGVVRMDEGCIVRHYNLWESRWAGLSAATVLGRHFFREVAPCADTPAIAGRLEAAAALDASFDHVFAFRMRVSPVRLRLLRAERGGHRYMLVRPR